VDITLEKPSSGTLKTKRYEQPNHFKVFGNMKHKIPSRMEIDRPIG
jgi:hypothetical protein